MCVRVQKDALLVSAQTRAVLERAAEEMGLVAASASGLEENSRGGGRELGGRESGLR